MKIITQIIFLLPLSLARWYESMELPYETIITDECNCIDPQLKLKLSPEDKFTIEFRGVSYSASSILELDMKTNKYKYTFDIPSKGGEIPCEGLITDLLTAVAPFNSSDGTTLIVKVRHELHRRKITFNDAPVCDPAGVQDTVGHVTHIKVEGIAKLMWVISEKPKKDDFARNITIKDNMHLYYAGVFNKDHSSYQLKITNTANTNDHYMVINYKTSGTKHEICMSTPGGRSLSCGKSRVGPEIKAGEDFFVAVKFGKMNMDYPYGTVEVYVNGTPIGRLGKDNTFARQKILNNESGKFKTSGVESRVFATWVCDEDDKNCNRVDPVDHVKLPKLVVKTKQLLLDRK